MTGHRCEIVDDFLVGSGLMLTSGVAGLALAVMSR